MFEKIKSALYKHKLKKYSDCHFFDVFVNKFDKEFHHIDYLLVVEDQILLIKRYDYSGNIYGADNISEWTQTIGHSGYKFHNPLRELREVSELIKRKLGGYTIQNYVVFSDKCNFPKQMPKNVLKHSELISVVKGMRRSEGVGECDEIRKSVEAQFKSSEA